MTNNPTTSNILIYQTEDGKTKILQVGELDESVVCAKFAHTTKHDAIDR